MYDRWYMCLRFDRGWTCGHKEKTYFPVQLTNSKIGKNNRLILTLLNVLTIHTLLKVPTTHISRIFIFVYLKSHLKPMDFIITILPVATKDIPIFPRFTPYDFLSRCKFSDLTTRQPMVEFYLLRGNNTSPTLVRIELATSALAGVQVTY